MAVFKCKMCGGDIAKKSKIYKIAAAFVVVVIIFAVLLNAVIIPNSKYNKAVKLMEAGKYQEAIVAFEALEGYKDSYSMINQCIDADIEAEKVAKYNKAVALMEEGNYQDAIVAFEAMYGYKDSDIKIAECNTAILNGKYDDALELLDVGNYVEAYEALIALGDYRESREIADSIYDEYKDEKLKQAEVGDYLFFGLYEQDNDISNGSEYIEWLILDVQDGKALVISKHSLDCKPYNNTKYENVTWETCTLRQWLNDDFISDAFTNEEQLKIPMVTVSAHTNPESNFDPGNDTQDKVFLLSILEANKYFASEDELVCRPTTYANSYSEYVSLSLDNWWLRSPGHNQYTIAYVSNSFGIQGDGCSLKCGNVEGYMQPCVRPAMWIEIG